MAIRRVTIGIPSFNEEQNLLNLLRSIENHPSSDFAISEIIISDDSSDNTPKLVERYAMNSSLNIRFMHHYTRRGAAAAWNEIFKEATGDVIVLYDADVIVERNCTEELVSSIQGKIGLCASNPTPVNATGLVARASTFLSNWLNLVRRNRISQYTVMGRGLSIRSDIAKKILIPCDIISIDLYLQCKALENRIDVAYNDNAIVYFYPPKSMLDFASQVIRGFNGHRQIRDYVIRFKINVSLDVLFIETVRSIITNPLGAASVIISYVFVPFYKFKLQGINSSKWDTAKSTKSSNEYRLR